MSEREERVARALLQAVSAATWTQDDPAALDSVDVDGPVDFLAAARAAIAALRKPTAFMKTAGFYRGTARFAESATVEDAAEVWRAMIDEALKP